MLKRTTKTGRRAPAGSLPLWERVETGEVHVEARVATGPPTLTVSELGRCVQGVLRERFDRVCVLGEISNFRAHGSGHCYFTLKDENAQIPAVMFRSAAARLKFRPADGLEVTAEGRVGFYEVQGKVQLYVERLEPRGLGALRQQLERLRKKLDTEGLFDPARKRPLPFLPRSIGLVTAVPSAAMRDVLRMLGDRFAERRVVIRPVRVQGIGSEIEIAEAIRDLQGIADVDVLILARGGGSIEDLWSFNDEGVARAIAASRIPVVSAVGHEIDVTIGDLVADLRVPTPTAAAERVLPRRVELEEFLQERRRELTGALARGVERYRGQVIALRRRLRDPRKDLALAQVRTVELRRRLVGAMVREVSGREERVSTLRSRLRVASPARRVGDARAVLIRVASDLRFATAQRVEGARAAVAGASARLSGMSPLSVLERGFAVVRRAGESRALRDAGEAAVGDVIDVQLHSGRLTAKVTGQPPADGSGGS